MNQPVPDGSEEPAYSVEKIPLDCRGHLFGEESANAKATVIHSDSGTHVFAASAHSSSTCGWCGAWADFEVVDGVARTPSPCLHSGGITSRITLAVPSGKIVVYDDLRHVYNGFSDDFASYNTALGQHQVVLAMAELGCAFGPVGNSCPRLYRTAENSYVIANPDYSDEGESTGFLAHLTPLAHIVTDLWAYSIADHDDYLTKGGSLDTGRGTGPDVVEIPPGVYEFVHHTGERGFDHYAHGTVVFAHINRIGDTP